MRQDIAALPHWVTLLFGRGKLAVGSGRNLSLSAIGGPLLNCFPRILDRDFLCVKSLPVIGSLCRGNL
jgi:hypothetical protein